MWTFSEIHSRKKTFTKSLGGPWPPWPPPGYATDSDRGDLLEKVFASDNKHYHDTRHEVPGIARAPRTRGRWRLPRWQLARARGDANAVHTSVSFLYHHCRVERESIVRYQLIKSVQVTP